MEERLIDRDKGSLTLGEEEATVEFSEEYDEDLVGLTPSELEAELSRRKRAEEEARREYERLMQTGKEALGADDFETAETAFLQASLYDGGNVGLWEARTHKFADTACFFREGQASAFAESDPSVKDAVLSAMREKMEGELGALRAEAEPLRATFEKEQGKRREAFRAHRNYYLVRFFACFCIFAALVVACGIAAAYLTRTAGNTPMILAIVFGAASLLPLAVSLVFARGLYLAGRLCRKNEDPSSTEDGARLTDLDFRIRCLERALGQ